MALINGPVHPRVISSLHQCPPLSCFISALLSRVSSVFPCLVFHSVPLPRVSSVPPCLVFHQCPPVLCFISFPPHRVAASCSSFDQTRVNLKFTFFEFYSSFILALLSLRLLWPVSGWGSCCCSRDQ